MSFMDIDSTTSTSEFAELNDRTELNQFITTANLNRSSVVQNPDLVMLTAENMILKIKLSIHQMMLGLEDQTVTRNFLKISKQIFD